MGSKTIIIAHRIVNPLINDKEKLSAFIGRLDQNKIMGVEFDVRQTKDNNFIAFHDERLSHFNRDIIDYTYEEFKKETRERGISFLTLTDVLEMIPPGFEIQIDLKDKKVDIDKFLEILYCFRFIKKIIVSSFYPSVILKLSTSKIEKRWLLTNIFTERNFVRFWGSLFPIRTAIFCRATGIAPHLSLISQKLINRAHRNNLTVAAWTVNPIRNQRFLNGVNYEGLINKLSKQKVDYIISDIV